MEPDTSKKRIWIVTTPENVSSIKHNLEDRNVFAKNEKLLRGPALAEHLHVKHLTLPEISIALPTTLCQATADLNILQDRLDELDIILPPHSHSTLAKTLSTTPDTPKPKNTSLPTIVSSWLSTLPSSIQLQANPQDTLSRWSTYTVYGDLLLLPSNLVSIEPWRSLLFSSETSAVPADPADPTDPEPPEPPQSSVPVLSSPPQAPVVSFEAQFEAQFEPHRTQLWQLLAGATRTTRIGLNAPIAARLSSGGDNLLRAPTGFVPVYGDFGAVGEDAAHSDSELWRLDRGFEKAYWAHARQNGITQVWAPLRTMFARGNVKEKARVLGFEVEEDCSAVDLYAGIGYFTFSYALAGARKVLCWEINPWSVEGLRRGAGENGWSVSVIPENTTIQETQREAKLLVFGESNEKALARVEGLRDVVPPVTHVNCGYLPTSSPIWRDAVGMLDAERGGWVHAHENVAIEDVECRTGELRCLFMGFAKARWESKRAVEVECEHVEKVKSYAPGVFHFVFDMLITPGPSK